MKCKEQLAWVQRLFVKNPGSSKTGAPDTYPYTISPGTDSLTTEVSITGPSDSDTSNYEHVKPDSTPKASTSTLKLRLHRLIRPFKPSRKARHASQASLPTKQHQQPSPTLEPAPKSSSPSLDPITPASPFICRFAIDSCTASVHPSDQSSLLRTKKSSTTINSYQTAPSTPSARGEGEPELRRSERVTFALPPPRQPQWDDILCLGASVNPEFCIHSTYPDSDDDAVPDADAHRQAAPTPHLRGGIRLPWYRRRHHQDDVRAQPGQEAVQEQSGQNDEEVENQTPQDPTRGTRTDRARHSTKIPNDAPIPPWLWWLAGGFPVRNAPPHTADEVRSWRRRRNDVLNHRPREGPSGWRGERRRRITETAAGGREPAAEEQGEPRVLVREPAPKIGVREWEEEPGRRKRRLPRGEGQAWVKPAAKSQPSAKSAASEPASRDKPGPPVTGAPPTGQAVKHDFVTQGFSGI